MKIKVHLFDCYIYFITFLIFGSEFGFIPFHEYFDELTALLCAFAIIYCFQYKKVRKAIKKDLFFLLGMILIGLLSNIVNRIVTNLGYILNDIFAFSRIFLVYIGMIALFEYKPKRMKKIIKTLGRASCFYIIITFVFCILNLTGIVHMYKQTRFGFPNYSFLYSAASQFGIFLGSALALYIFSGKSNQIVEVMALITLFFTLKGTSLIILAVYVFMYLFLKRKIKWWHIVVSAIGLSFVLSFQIQNYLVNTTHARSILIHYGIITAIRFFPLGSGFATYGSNMAATHYSPLYVEYNFELYKRLGRIDPNNPTSTFLNDVYLGMILGEFGFLGLLMLIIFIYEMWKKINSNSNTPRKAKQITIALFVCLCGSFVMLGSIKNSQGQILMLVIAFFIEMNKQFAEINKEEASS